MSKRIGYQPTGSTIATMIADSLQVCECGDYRRDHWDGTGSCRFNKPDGIGHHGAANCMAFRLDPNGSATERDEQTSVQGGK